MDTSTPLKRSSSKKLIQVDESALPNEYIADCSSFHSKREAKHDVFSIEVEPSDSDRIYPDLYSKWTDTNTSAEVFPVSPICCAKNAPADFLNIPFLDSSNLKWSTSLHTSYAEDEAIELTECDDSIRVSSRRYATTITTSATAEAATSTALNGNENDFGIADKLSINEPYSPIFVCSGGRGRSARRRKIKEPPDEQFTSRQRLSDSDGENARALRLLKLDDFDCETFELCAWPSQSMTSTSTSTSRTRRYSFNLARNTSKRFVYPLVSASIKKPQRSLNVDQLTNCALSLETCDSTRSRSDSSSRFVDCRMTKNEVVAFNQLYDNHDNDELQALDLMMRVETAAYRSRQRRKSIEPYTNVWRALAQIMFASKNSHDDIIRARFDKIADQSVNVNGGCVLQVRSTLALYSAYYFVARVDLVSYKTEPVYKRACVRQLMDGVSNSFKLEVCFDVAANALECYTNDIYVLERMGIPMTSLYATRCAKGLRCWFQSKDHRPKRPTSKSKRVLSSELMWMRERNNWSENFVDYDGGSRVCRRQQVNCDDQRRNVLAIPLKDELATGATNHQKYELCFGNGVELENTMLTVPSTYAQATHFNDENRNVANAFEKTSIGNSPLLGFKTGSGRTIGVGDKSLEFSARLLSDISMEGKRGFDDNCRRDGAKKTTVSGFKTSSNRTICVDEMSLRNSARLFSDIPMEDKCDFGNDCRRGGAKKTTVSGLKTSSNRKICINEMSLRNSARLFSDISTSDKRDLGGVGGDSDRETVILGFKTSSGKTISVGGSSLRNSSHIFSDISTKSECNFDCVDNDDDDRSNVKMVASGFKTSSGKMMDVDNESLHISTRLFSDILTEDNRNFDGGENMTASSFKTCSGKMINVDDSSLRMSAHLFSDIANASSSTSIAETFKTDAGKVVNVGMQSLEKFDNLLANLAGSTTVVENQSIERASFSQHVQNQSFDLSREITESASAFLYDISHEQSSWCSFFAPNDSDGNTSTTADTKFSADCDSDVKSKISGDCSRSCSPVFDSKYGSRNRLRSSRRGSGGRQSLDITYVRKMPITATVDQQSAGNVTSSHQVCVELETLKMHFSSKASKRKSSSTDDSDVRVDAKKFKNDMEELVSPQNRATAVACQQSYISNKPKHVCRPTRGYLSALIHGGNGDNSANGRISLRNLARFEKPKLYLFDEYVKFGLLPMVIRLNSQNARHFIFTSQFFSDRQLKTDGANCTTTTLFGDAVPVLFNEKNQVTFEEVASGFLASPGVDPKLVSREWLANHYRWIVWKLASYERFFPKSLGGKYLTLDNVLFQLKFRYEQEIDLCVRSALKRILEGDDSPARPLILCVASIVKEADSFNEYKMELTDGWYSIFAQTNHQIDDFITRKKLLVGSKLIIAGAELIGLREPCDPLQVSETIRLKFSVNSSRRVRWNTRLGFYNGSLGPMNRIQTILPKGDLIAYLTAVVTRVYPSLFLEKYDNAATSGSADVSVTANANVTWSRLHNEKVEMRMAMAFERDRQSFIESIFSQVTNEVLSENAKTNADSFADNERLRSIIQQRVQSRLPMKFSKNRHVNRLLKLRLVDAQDVKNKSSAVLTIWNPCDDMAHFFKEGRSYKFFNINANGIRNGELQLCSIRSSKYDRDENSIHSSGNINDNGCWFARRVCSVDDFSRSGENDNKSCSLDEVDVAGVIIRIDPNTNTKTETRTQPQSVDFQQSCRIYLADLQQRFVALSFRIDPKNFDFGDSMKNGKIVAGLNLQWKNGWLCWKIPVLYVNEFSSFVQTTNIESLQPSIDQVRRYFQTHNLETFLAECEEKLKGIADSLAETSVDNDNVAGCEKVNRAGASKESNGCNKTVLSVANQTTFKNSDVRSKFERLQNYGRPPALSPIVLTSQSKTKAKLPLLISKRSFTNLP